MRSVSETTLWQRDPLPMNGSHEWMNEPVNEPVNEPTNQWNDV